VRGARRFGTLLLCLAGSVSAGDEYPLPTRTSTILSRDGVTYFVEGRQTIPWGCEISVQKDVRIAGRGAGAVLVVEGELKVHGVTGKEVVIDGLSIEPAPKFGEIRLDKVFVRGGATLRTPEGAAVDGRIVIENTDFEQGTHLDVRLTGGRIDLLNAMSYEPARIAGADPGEGKRNRLTVNANGCFFKPTVRSGSSDGRTGYSGFLNGLFVSGAAEVLVRNCRMAGGASEFADNGKLTFDGNKVDSERLVFKQSEPGRFKGLKLSKCDFYGRQIVLFAPKGKRKERVVIDKCWFRDVTDRRKIEQSFIHDGDDDEACGVYATFRKINKRPLQLAGKRKQ